MWVPTHTGLVLGQGRGRSGSWHLDWISCQSRGMRDTSELWAAMKAHISARTQPSSSLMFDDVACEKTARTSQKKGEFAGLCREHPEYGLACLRLRSSENFHGFLPGRSQHCASCGNAKLHGPVGRKASLSKESIAALRRLCAYGSTRTL